METNGPLNWGEEIRTERRFGKKYELEKDLDNLNRKILL